MDGLLAAYLPQDRCQALAAGTALPEQAEGSALFADIAGFTPLTEALDRALGARRGVEDWEAPVILRHKPMIDWKAKGRYARTF